jgi:hypothetical protein
MRRKGGPDRTDLKRPRPGDDPVLRQRTQRGREEVGMAITAAGAVVPLDEKRRRRHDLLAQLREVDHWRRLVTARLDLAVAAVTDIDEPDVAGAEALGAALPPGLREILGLPACDQALPEASVLIRLRAAQRDLDEYARSLRACTDLATLELAALMDAARGSGPGPDRGTERVCEPEPERSGGRAARRAGYARPNTTGHLHVVADPTPESTGQTAHSTESTP